MLLLKELPSVGENNTAKTNLDSTRTTTSPLQEEYEEGSCVCVKKKRDTEKKRGTTKTEIKGETVRSEVMDDRARSFSDLLTKGPSCVDALPVSCDAVSSPVVGHVRWHGSLGTPAPPACLLPVRCEGESKEPSPGR